jgi:uncharacterized protein (DUF427 family)
MALTIGTGPFGHEPAGRFDVEPAPDETAYVEPSPRRVRPVLDGETVPDSTRAKMLHRHAQLARYFFPREDRASYRSHPAGGEVGENVAWCYPAPLENAARVAGYIAFFDERIDLDVDGERRPRPRTPWGAPGWWRVPPPEI